MITDQLLNNLIIKGDSQVLAWCIDYLINRVKVDKRMDFLEETNKHGFQTGWTEESITRFYKENEEVINEYVAKLLHQEGITNVPDFFRSTRLKVEAGIEFGFYIIYQLLKDEKTNY